MAGAFSQGWDVGSSVFVNDEEEGWVEASITKVAGVGRSATLNLRLRESGRTLERDASEVEAASKLSLEGVSDMTTLDDLTEATVLSTLRARYKRKEIYTNVGGILVAVNPYEKLSDATYGEDAMFAYGGADVAFTGCEPHPYLLAESALRALDRDRESQSFVISGESGSGKTETCKYILRYLSYRSKRRYEHTVSHAESDARSNALEESVLLSNPILEAFGNAKTSRNDNSSRWGKYTQVYVQPASGAIERVGITAYLLEKVRVIERFKGERNYHIFYQLVAGFGAGTATRHDGCATMGTASDAHAVLRDAAGGVKNPKDVKDVDTFVATKDAMSALAVDEASAYLAIAAVAHLGDIRFEAEASDGQDTVAKVAATDLSRLSSGTPKALDAAATSLGVDANELAEALISRQVAAVRVPRNDAEAEVAKQAFAKALYSRLFAWVLRRVNEALKALTGDQPQKMTRAMLLGTEDNASRAAEATLTIGLLDIFGFEAFATNSLEQLLINYANERLLQEFNKQVFEAATAEYEAEGVDVGDLTYHDNSGLLHTLENPRDGVFATLNSECVRRDGNDRNFLSTLLKRHGASGPNQQPTSRGLFVPKIHRHSSKEERDAVGTVFGVSHFAASVTYSILGFVEKNRDRLPDEICQLVATSDRAFIAALFADVDDDSADASNGNPPPGSGATSPPHKSGSSSAASHHHGSKKKATRYVAAAFGESLTLLTHLLDATSQSFVRCIKPNHKMMARQFEGSIVLDQLRCMGMLELVEARRRGYARRIDHATFVSRYALLLDDEENGEENAADDASAAPSLSSAATPKKKDSSYSSSLMSMLSSPAGRSSATTTTNGESPKPTHGLSATQRWEQRGGSPQISKEFVGELKRKKLIKNTEAFKTGLAIGKTKVFLKREALDELESMREERLKRDVLLALGEATENRDAMQLELTLRIADELRLGETDEARLARSTLTDERAFQDIYGAVVDLCDDGKSTAVDDAFNKHNIPLAGDGDVDPKKKESTSTASEDLPFSSGQWFAGSQWSKYVVDVSRVARTARAGDRACVGMANDVTTDVLDLARAFMAAAAKEIAAFESAANDEDARAPPVDSLKRLADKVREMVGKAEARVHIAASLRALKNAVAAKKLADIKSALATLDALPAEQAETLMTDKDDDAIVEARALAKRLEALDVLGAEVERLSEVTRSSDAAKAFVAKPDAPTQVEKLDGLVAIVEQLGGADLDPALVADAKKIADKIRDSLAARAPPAPKPTAAAAPAGLDDTTTAAEKTPAAAAAAAQQAAIPAPLLETTKEERQITERKLAREKRREESMRELQAAEARKAAEKDDAAGISKRGPTKEMQGLTNDEKAAIAAEEAKRIQTKTVLFCDMDWSTRVQLLIKGTRMLKLSSTSSVQGAEWKQVRLETPQDARGESLLCQDPTFKNPASRAGAFLTWPSNTLLRRGSRKLAIASITGVHVGTNAKQWCTMVPTEWHYMTLTTPERSYDFGFESAATLLLWVNTLQRITFPDWTRQCDAGEMSELFKGAISDAQHRFYRSSRAGASPSDAFKPSLPELCPVLYPLASKLCRTCADLGVSFASNAERAQKFCMWTAVAVLEAPVGHDSAVTSMRAVLSDLGFYAEGRFACSAGFYDENGLAHTLAKDAIASTTPGDKNGTHPSESGMLVIRAQHAKTGKVSVLKIKKGTKMASVFEAHAKHKGLRTQALSVVK
ncbi:hypothetical protein CTAYLR_009881 [Chrysophaeum taylorii]|uniref:Myosin motor domain-containing protein n=1 Tax=Chrysophaeum taylorii TaxID=2483200 RepID=A0AAD7XMX5_9STRA|nr:hypothetical protein CTAYLR_009881 [Chrysophaeum taylorii]